MITIKRIYEPVDNADGYRVLVDRLWPRGVKREAAALDEWAKTITPSNDLRLWYAHLPQRWDEFQIRYRLELSRPEQVAELARLAAIAGTQNLTLLTAARSKTENHALVLRQLLIQNPPPK